MKKPVVIIGIVGILIISVILIGKLIIQVQPGLKIAPQTKKQDQDARAAEQAAALKPLSASRTSTLQFDSQTQTVSAGATFSLKAQIDPKGKKISASELHINFDPKVLKLESISPSDDFSLVLANSKIDNEKGIASIALGIPLGKPAMEAISTIAGLNFQALSKGETKVIFTDESGAAADGESSNVVSLLVPVTIFVQ
jgi:hypothetical protein